MTNAIHSTHLKRRTSLLMNFDPVSLIAGLFVFSLGVMMTSSHRTSWRQQQQDFIDEPRELRHFQARYRRRVQTSALIAFVGVMIPIADLPIVWQQGPVIATLLWGAIGCVCLWIGLLAIGDLATTKAHSKATIARLKAHQADLVNQLERLRGENTNSSSDANPSGE